LNKEENVKAWEKERKKW